MIGDLHPTWKQKVIFIWTFNTIVIPMDSCLVFFFLSLSIKWIIFHKWFHFTYLCNGKMLLLKCNSQMQRNWWLWNKANTLGSSGLSENTPTRQSTKDRGMAGYFIPQISCLFFILTMKYFQLSTVIIFYIVKWSDCFKYSFRSFPVHLPPRKEKIKVCYH